MTRDRRLGCLAMTLSAALVLACTAALVSVLR